MGFTIGISLVINLFGSAIFLALFPQGGGISFYPVPLIMFAWRWGWKPAFVMNAIYGWMCLLLPGSVVLSFYQLFLDFGIGYLPFALAAIARRWILNLETPQWKIYLAIFMGILVPISLQFVEAFWSGVFFYSQYAGPGQGPYIYSFIYNITSTAGTFGVTLLIFWSAQSQFVRLARIHYAKYH